jgi:hypothetical protein
MPVNNEIDVIILVGEPGVAWCSRTGVQSVNKSGAQVQWTEVHALHGKAENNTEAHTCCIYAHASYLGWRSRTGLEKVKKLVKNS